MLLPLHHFCFGADFRALGSVPRLNRLIWLADMDFAVATSTVTQMGKHTPEATAHFSIANQPRSYNQGTSCYSSAGSHFYIVGVILVQGSIAGQVPLAPSILSLTRFAW
jgi:hypothetical protein